MLSVTAEAPLSLVTPTLSLFAFLVLQPQCLIPIPSLYSNWVLKAEVPFITFSSSICLYIISCFTFFSINSPIPSLYSYIPISPGILCLRHQNVYPVIVGNTKKRYFFKFLGVQTVNKNKMLAIGQS